MTDNALVERIARALRDALRASCRNHDGSCYATVDESYGTDGVWAAEVDGEINLCELAAALLPVIEAERVAATNAILETGKALHDGLKRARNAIPDDADDDLASELFARYINRPEMEFIRACNYWQPPALDTAAIVKEET